MPPEFTPVYRRYVLSTLTLVYMLSSLDQSLMSLVLQPIKEDLHLSDSQLGFLNGIAFALFYSTLGVPIARWADRGNRVTIASLAIGLWGVTVMSCLIVGNFAQLVATRVAAGIGGAGCMPPTYSLLGDYFPASTERTRVMAVYMMSGPAGSVVSYVAGGWLNQHYGWRVALFAMGIPGLIVAILLKTTLREPRVRTAARDASEAAMPSTVEVFTELWRQRASRHLSMALIVLITLTGGMFSWLASFLIRNHRMTTADLGVWFGLIFGLSGTVGVSLGGYIAQRWFSGDEQGQMNLFAALTALLVPCYALLLLSSQKTLSLIALSLCVLVGNFAIGPAFALIQRLVVNETRATTMAIIMLLANLLGMGFGPQIVGILSDSLKGVAGNDSLRYSMLTMSLLAPWSAYHFWQVGRVVREELRAVALIGDSADKEQVSVGMAAKPDALK